MLAVIDYGAGNLTSVGNVLERIGQSYRITSDLSEIAAAERIIFPGVGAAGSAMDHLKEKGLDQALVDFARSGKPMMGICVGCQILLDRSEENDGVQTLGLIPGEVRKFSSEEGVKIPHMGWNAVHFKKEHALFEGIADGSHFYYVHSYFPVAAQAQHVLATSQYGTQTFDGALLMGNLFATQFHAEKSGEVGLRLMSNFCNWQGDCGGLGC